MTATPGEITRLLQKADQGDDSAADELFRLVQMDLKAIAKNIRRGFGQDIDAQTTMLVNEAFLRLVGRQATQWQAGDRARFYSFVATKVHNMLVDHVRKAKSKKAGGQLKPVALTANEVEDATRKTREHETLIIDLQDALVRFEQFAEKDASTFRIRYFLDCSFRETAEILEISVSECKRRFARAKLWLRRELKDYGHES